MEKSTITLIVIVALLVVIGGGLYFLLSSPTVSAQLMIESGNIQVDLGSGFQAASDGMLLSVKDRVKNVDGEASIILHESVVIELDPGTEIVIDDLNKEHLKLNQPSGQTWNKFTKIAGVGTLEIATPVTVATVRGTFFGLTANKLMLGEGRVDARVGSNTVTLSGRQKMEAVDGVPETSALTEDELNTLHSHGQKMVMWLRRVREAEILKNDFALSMVEKRYGMSKKDVFDKLLALDGNDEDLDQLFDQAPMKTPALKKIQKLTEEIRRVKKEAEKQQEATGDTPTPAE